MSFEQPKASNQYNKKELKQSARLAKTLHEEYKEQPKAIPRLTFPFPLSENRRKAIEIIKKDKTDIDFGMELIKSNDLVEKEAGLELLLNVKKFTKKQQKEIINTFFSSKLFMDYKFRLNTILLDVLGNFDQDGIEYLKEIRGLITPIDHIAANHNANSTFKIMTRFVVKDNLPYLTERVSKEVNPSIRYGATNQLHILKEEGIPLLSELIYDKDLYVAISAIRNIERLGKKAIPILEEFLNKKAKELKSKEPEDEENKHIILTRHFAADSLVAIGKEAIPSLKRLTNDSDTYVCNLALVSLLKFSKNKKEFLESIKNKKRLEDLKKITENSKPFLLPGQKPLFATNYPERLVKNTIEIQEIVEELKNKFPDDFIGIQVFGSTSKGYSIPESDIDAFVISKTPKPFEYYKEKQTSFKKCEGWTQNILWTGDSRREAVTIYEMGRFFQGLFFGDHKKLLGIQASIISRVDEEIWDIIRHKLFTDEIDVADTKERFVLGADQTDKIAVMSSLSRVPPPLTETKRIIDSRVKNS